MKNKLAQGEHMMTATNRRRHFFLPVILLALTSLLSISLLPARDVSARAVGNYEPQLFKDINPE
jgi:hypothetical protein